jgi:hypothetical protein
LPTLLRAVVEDDGDRSVYIFDFLFLQAAFVAVWNKYLY